MAEYVKMAVQNILANKGRSFLTMLGIIIGIASVIAIVSIGEGTRNQMNSEIDGVGSGQIYIYCSEDAMNEGAYITPEDLAGVPLIMPRRASIQSEIANWFGEYYSKLHVLMTSNLPAGSAVMANQQLAYSINTCGSVDFWDQTKLTYRPLKPELSATCALAWKRQQPFGIAAEKFIEHVCKALQK